MANEQNRQETEPDFSGMLTPEFVDNAAKNIFAGHEDGDVASAIIGLSPEAADAVNATFRMARNQTPLADRPVVDLSKTDTGVPMAFEAPAYAQPKAENLSDQAVPGVIVPGVESQLTTEPMEPPRA
jgi:hypothetical protein